MLYLVVKWLHVLSAIVAVGSNVTYGVWIARASRKPDVLSFTLRGIKLIDDRLANPAYGLLLVTGFAMVGLAHLPIRLPWLLTSLVLYTAVVLLGLFGYTPTLREQIRILESEGPRSPRYLALARRGGLLGGVLAVLVTLIVFLMVVKPALWG